MRSAQDERLRYLVIEGEEAREASLASSLEPMVAYIAVAHGKSSALELAKERFSGIVLDAELPDGSVLEILAGLREQGVYTPTLVLAHPSDATTWSAAQCHGAYLLPRPFRQESLAAFVHWTKRFRRAAQAHLDGEIRALGHRHGLTAREQEVVRLAASGVARHELMTALRVEESTVKTTVRRLLRKARRSTLSEIVSEVHRAVFLEPNAEPLGAIR